MPLFFIPTNSCDATCDILLQIFMSEQISVFRWNIDLWQSYEIVVTDHALTVTDPTGRLVDLTAPDVYLLWRKPFADLMTFDGLPLTEVDQQFAQKQIVQWLYAVVAFMTSRGRVRLIEPYADRRIPKLFQLMQATKFFEVPRFVFSTQNWPLECDPMVVTKSLGDPTVGEGKIFYTNLIASKELVRPYPWFVQEAVVTGTDVTCVHIRGENFFYECDFVRHENAVDWRTEINSPNQSGWRSLEFSRIDSLSNSVSALMKSFKLHYGRLDFLRQKDKIYFLECNTNGQFGWLDDAETLQLHKRFADAALNPNSSVI
jgi:hypothetical protein